MSVLRTLASGTLLTHEIEIKRSRFITTLARTDTPQEARALIDAVKSEHPQARHNCSAYLIDPPYAAPLQHSSDDGEPSGTAGKPILDVLRANELTDCVVAVTRYFGGILLGSGGLIRAYSTGASLAVKAASQARIVPCVRYSVRLEYPQLAIFQRLLADCEGRSDDERYTDRVTLRAIVPQERSETFESRTREAFNASVTPERLDVVNHPVAL